MERNYTIPVNEAFDKTDICPICTLKMMLEKNELDLILGASMMEPDIREKTNELGFCGEHFTKMAQRNKRLPLALMLESHLDKIKSDVKLPSVSLGSKTESVAHKVGQANKSCYVCERIDAYLEKMIETVCILWSADKAFREKFDRQPFFCLPHYESLLLKSKSYVPKKQRDDFLKAADRIESAYLQKLKDDVSWFCKKFDYRYKDEPWLDSKDAIERSIAFLSGRYL